MVEETESDRSMDLSDDVTTMDGHDSSMHGAAHLDLQSFMADKKFYRCTDCRYVTDRKNNLKRHVVTMHQLCGKTLECCDTVFTNKACLRDHVLLCHKQGYECKICHRNFCRKALLKRHVTVHSGQKDFICSVCGYATSHKSNLDRHKRRHGPRNLPLVPLDITARITEAEQIRQSAFSLLHSQLFSNEKFDLHSSFPARAVPSYSMPPPEDVYYASYFPTALHNRKKVSFRSHMLSCRLDQTHGTAVDFPENSDVIFRGDVADDVNDVTDRNGKSSADADCNAPIKYNFSPKRICPIIYRCSFCNAIFKNQLELRDHYDICKATTPPMIPLSVLAKSNLYQVITG